MTHAAAGAGSASGALPIRLLVAEDEEHLGTILEHFLRGRGYVVTMCRDGESALRALRGGGFDVALVDIVMPGMDGLEVLRHLAAEPEPPQVIIITGNGTIDTAITAIRLGAYDYIAKPYRMAEIDVVVRRAWEKRELIRSTAMLQGRVAPLPARVETVVPAMQAAVLAVEGAADGVAVVVLRGEPGAGKSHLARLLHARSPSRAPAALVEVTAAACARSGQPAGALLFGAMGGAAPAAPGAAPPSGGAPATPGALSIAERGTVVVDAWVLEAEARRALEAALARGAAPHVADAAPPLHARIVVCERPGMPRLAVPPGSVAVDVPPLRDRAADVPALALALLGETGERAVDGAAAGAVDRVVDGDGLAALAAYAWPGNVRELRAVLVRGAALAGGGMLRGADLRLALASGAPHGAPGGALAELERAQIEAMLLRCNWHQGRAAAALGISTKTLYRKMRAYGFARPRTRGRRTPGAPG